MAFINVEAVGSKLGRARSVDWAGILLLFIGFGSLQILLQEGQRKNWFASNFIIWLTVIAVIGIIVFVWRELTAEHPVVDLKVFRHRNLAVGSAFGFIMGLGLYSSVFVFPLYLENLLGYSALQTGLLLIPSALSAALMMPVVSFLLRKGAPARIIAMCGFILFFIFSWIMSGQSLHSGAGDFIFPLVLRGIGLGSLSVPINTITMWGLEGHDLAEGSALSSITRSLGGSFGIALITVFLQQRLALHWQRLATNITQYNYTARHTMQNLQHKFMSSGFPSTIAHSQAYQSIAGLVRKEASMMSYNDIFLAVGVAFLCCIPFLLLMYPEDESEKDTEDEEHIEASEEEVAPAQVEYQ
jgi:DHA2 family multidrug resistance protein